MNCALSVIEQLAELGVSLWVDGGRLKYRGPVDALHDDLRARVIRQRDDLVALLARAGLPGARECWTESLRESFEERAGVIEFDGGLERVEAELRAEARVRLQALRPAGSTW